MEPLIQCLKNSTMCVACMLHIPCLKGSNKERERENYAEKGGNPFLHILREWTLT